MVFSVFLVLGGAALTLGATSTYRTRAQVDGQQTYFTARSAVGAAVRYIQSDAGIRQKIAALATVGDSLSGTYGFSGQQVDSPTVKIEVAELKDGKPSVLKITASASQNGVTSRAAAYLTASAAPDVPDYPFEDLVYINGPADDGQLYADVHGNVTISGDARFNSGSEMDGTVRTGGYAIVESGSGIREIHAAGNVTLSTGSVVVEGDVDSGGTVTVNGGASVNGNIYAREDVNAVGCGALNGNIYALGNLSLTNISSSGRLNDIEAGGNLTISSSRVNGTATVYGNASFGWGGFVQSLFYGGNFTLPQNGQRPSFVASESKLSGPQVQNGLIDLRTMVNAQMFHFEPPVFEIPALPTDVVGENRITLTSSGPFEISQSGYLSEDGSLNAAVRGTPFYFDTDAAGGDIFLIADRNMVIPYGIKFYVKGPHRVLLYLSGPNTALTIHGDFRNDPAGPYADDPPQLYIYGTWPGDADGRNDQKVSLSGGCVDAYVYLPNGSVDADSADHSRDYSFRGGLCARHASLENDLVMKYVAPPASGTPGGGTPGAPEDDGTAWRMDGWAE